jgi:hypothetical protein
MGKERSAFSDQLSAEHALMGENFDAMEELKADR